MLKKELHSSNYDRNSVYNKSELESTLVLPVKPECSLSNIPFDPTKSSPKDLFLNKIIKRMEKYYEHDISN